MPELVMRFDMRAPGPTPPEDLYRAALDMSAWADEQGFDIVRMSEHHGSEDGYLPSPGTFAAAVAARTRQVRVRLSVLVLPLHHPLRAAEELAVLDLISGGRLEVVIGAGYVPHEFEMFGVDRRERAVLVERGVETLLKAWTGEPFEYEGNQVRITPRPAQRPHPRLLLGGSSPASARRAARLGLEYYPNASHLFEDYDRERERLGLPPVPRPGPAGPMFLHVAEDPERVWEMIAPHAMHETNMYAAWLSAGDDTGPFARADDPDELRTRGTYRVVTPDECVELARSLGADGSLVLHPLMGGLAPRLAWESLELFRREVVPRLERARMQ